MTDPAVRVEGISKQYRLGTIRKPYGRLSESMSAAFGRALKRNQGKEEKEEEGTFWALSDVTFDVAHGEVVGIIGRNGAGKTTLLKILSRITEPTRGEARLQGRVGALLEVGAGFHHELTGRENVFLSGAILGMKGSEIKRQFDEIVAFAEIARFIDTPVKRYSSGMFLRLAFAVAAHLEPDILIVDEVLAVGDASFQKKCLGKMDNIASSGRTVLFVSHNMGAVKSLCQRAILLEGGRTTFDGDPSDAISKYLTDEGADAGGEVWFESETDILSCPEAAVRGVRLLSPLGTPQGVHEADQPIDVEIFYEIKSRIRGTRFILAVMTPEGEIAFKTTDHKLRVEADEPGLYRSICRIPGELLNRRNYKIVLSFDIVAVRLLLRATEVLSFMIAGGGNHGSDFPETWSGVVSPRCDWSLERLASVDDIPAIGHLPG